MLGRFTGVDPISAQFPHVSTYNYAENEPIGCIDLWGLQQVKVNGRIHHSLGKFRKSIAQGTFAFSNPKAIEMIGIPSQLAGGGNGGMNISSIAFRFGDSAFNTSSKSNAFRHVIWQSKITKAYGLYTASEIGNAHEGIRLGDNVLIDEHAPASIFSFNDADSTADLLNNKIGQSIGSQLNNNATYKDIANKILDVYHEEGLYEPVETTDGKYKIEKVKLSDEEYEYAKEKLNNLDDYGFEKKS